MGGQYEVKDGATKKYYSIAGMMVAVNDGTGLQYLLTDHLGSTVAVINASGTLTSQQRYLPFGTPRTIPNSPLLGTDFTYTGQRKLDDGMGGIMDYRARFYSPQLGRFIQPDSIIPDQFNPQSWNRFGYVQNNPILFNDPTGHMLDEGEGGGCNDVMKCLKDKQDQVIHDKQEDKRKCNSGNDNYCSTVELIVKRRPKPVSGIHVGYSWQTGLTVERGFYTQYDFLIDWKAGNLYITHTVGDFYYVGTPTGVDGSLYVGTSNVHGMPSDASDISTFLAGPQRDGSISVNVDAGLMVGAEKGISVDVDDRGDAVYIPGAGYMYTTENSFQFGGNEIPNVFDTNIEWGSSDTDVLQVIPLW